MTAQAMRSRSTRSSGLPSEDHPYHCQRDIFGSLFARSEGLREVSLRLAFAAAVLLTFTPSLAQAQEPSSSQVNQAIDAAERICLVGNRYKFQVDASGQLTISKLLPGGSTNITVDRADAKGSQFFENEEVRRLVDQDIRDCMRGQWMAVLPYLADKATDNNTKVQQLYASVTRWLGGSFHIGGRVNGGSGQVREFDQSDSGIIPISGSFIEYSGRKPQGSSVEIAIYLNQDGTIAAVEYYGASDLKGRFLAIMKTDLKQDVSFYTRNTKFRLSPDSCAPDLRRMRSDDDNMYTFIDNSVAEGEESVPLRIGPITVKYFDKKVSLTSDATNTTCTQNVVRATPGRYRDATAIWLYKAQ